MKINKIISFTVLAFLLFFTQARPVFAHPADVYAHSIYVTFTQDALSVKWEIKPGPMLVSYLWFEADADKNDVVSEEEVQVWAKSRASKLTAFLNNSTLPLTLDKVDFPSTRDAFQAGSELITFYLSAPWPEELNNSFDVTLRNGLEEQKSLNWYYLTSEDGIQFQAPQQKNNNITVEVFPSTVQAAEGTKLLSAWDSSMPSLSSWQGGSSQPTVESTPQPAPETTPQEVLLNLVREKDTSLTFYLFALGISLVLGALHALTPGHGKTVVAAYLVGSRGTTWHAVVLGTVVTLTHTGSVFLLGIITLAASQYILPTSIIPLLEILSGLLIVGLGLYLLWQRFLYWRKTRISAPAQVESVRKYSLSPASSTRKKISGVSKVEKPSADLHHHGDGKLHSHGVPEAITWRSLIALGVSGGLVPCPDAIAILLVAVAINRIFLGLALIVFFSLGLAVVLIVIGLLMVNSRRLFDRVSFLDKLAPVMPIVSAIVVLALGFALTWGAFARAKENFNWGGAGSRSMEEARVIYLLEDEDNIKQLLITNIKKNDPVALNEGSNSVVDFSLSPDESRVAYVVQTADMENKIWLVNIDGTQNEKISECENAICSGLVWSPDGSSVAYEHIGLSGDNATGLPTLWWIDLNTGVDKPLFQESQLPAANPRWSPDGKWISYATSESVRLYNLENGESRTIHSLLGTSANWSADGERVLFRDVIIQDNQFITQLFIYELSSETITNISPDIGFENILAAWSPDGEWIAVVRRDLSVPRGDQVWVMRADGSEARAVTNTPAVLHGSLNWSPDGSYILYDLYVLDSFPLESGLQVVDVESGEITDLEIKGYNPKWIWP